MNNDNITEIEGLPKRVEVARTRAADEYHEHLKEIPTMLEHVATEKWVSFRTGFKYGFRAAEEEIIELTRESADAVRKREREIAVELEARLSSRERKGVPLNIALENFIDELKGGDHAS